MSDSRIITIYTALTCLLLMYQPRLVFELDGRPVPIGLGPGKTLFHMQTVMVIFALFSVVLASKLDGVRFQFLK